MWHPKTHQKTHHNLVLSLSGSAPLALTTSLAGPGVQTESILQARFWKNQMGYKGGSGEIYPTNPLLPRDYMMIY